MASLRVASVLALVFVLTPRAHAQHPPRATATLETDSVVGALVASDVEDLPVRAAAGLSRCAARRTATTTGDSTRVELVIDPRGRVTTATILGTGGTDPARAAWLGCISESLRAARFPRRDATSTITVRVAWSDGSSSGLSGRRAPHFDHAVETHRPAVEDTAVGYPNESINTVVRSHTREIRHCFEAVLPEHPGLHGHIDVAFTIQADGSVGDVETRSDQPNVAALTQCVLEAVRRWVFPAPGPSHTVPVVYPFVFS